LKILFVDLKKKHIIVVVVVVVVVDTPTAQPGVTHQHSDSEHVRDTPRERFAGCCNMMIDS